MVPTFAPRGDVVLVEHISPRLRMLRPGDLVTCVSPENPSQHICKRLVALEGTPVAVARNRPPGGLLARLFSSKKDSCYYELLEVRHPLICTHSHSQLRPPAASLLC